ncbi:cytochrome c3 family protein [Methanonatronarchaeum sp. AMET6-2]|uniref:cytochrome c3 family protein n=1 Tax=Methanonatronarchaeum sp. AMET6-2 TaxID=2933293 RepID=UPI0011F5F0FE|nr:cytochrome c3 family protein [Methanonatronarchaeum sp. AMET6-2]RZN61834.1 MAG: hypothetical protein EF811_04415 [Methanonatronarchaeia archaeon]UOY09706.1 cytochrome c3 family protein [Methanonatronarchaeum sp. AMET6-2]
MSSDEDSGSMLDNFTFKHLSIVLVAVAVIGGLAAAPGAWDYTSQNQFCDDCHKDMDFPNEIAFSTPNFGEADRGPPVNGTAEQHVEIFEMINIEEGTDCVQCHVGDDLQSVIDEKVFGAMNEVFQFYIMGERDFPEEVEIPDEYCTQCHTAIEEDPGNHQAFNVSGYNCGDCHQAHDDTHYINVDEDTECAECHLNWA